MATEGTGAGPARDLGRGWKISPSVSIAPGDTFVLADIEGPGAIQHIWLTPTGGWRNQILRISWDDDPQAAVECPVGDFFACGWGEFAQVSSLAVCVNPGSAFNSYWPMPFRRRAVVTLTNESERERLLYYQITYARGDVDDDAAYFCAQFRRVNPLPKGEVVHDPRRRAGTGAVRRHVLRVGREQLGLVGRGRGEVLHRRRRGVPDDLRHGHRGLLLRLVQLRRRWPVPRVHDAVRGDAAGAPSRRRLSLTAALRFVPLAPHRPDPVPHAACA